MESPAFDAKPAVLRCSRCGRFVDWAESRLQVVCDCRSRLELPPVFVRAADDSDRAPLRELFARDFGHTGKIVAFGEEVSLEAAPAIVAGMRDELGGALAYRLLGNALHIVALATDPMWQRAGVGGYLLAEAQLLARKLNLQRLVVATSNDNLPALYFYQRHGFEMLELIPGAILSQLGRQVAGFAGIPIRDEVRLQKSL
ncbi:MAG TPA: GNAT family N-acetyltransferase [Vicinamibacterales bacterium]|jgi:ribosomal protein S18 acetylase RimI-like enzyme